MRRIARILVIFLPACGDRAIPKPPAVPPPQVTVATPVKRTITPYYEMPGRTVPVERVEIRARVTGFLERMLYEVGSDRVSAGDVLFVIEKDEYIAQRDQAKAAVAAAEASLEKAKSDLERFTEALKKNAVSEVQVTQARAEKLLAEASVQEAKAALQRAELNLSYCDVRTPIDGIPGRNLVDVGNLVGPNNTPVLTTVVEIKPIRVEFDVPENLLNEARRRRADEGKELRPGEDIEVRVATPGDDGFPHVGRVEWFANEVDPDTGTLAARAIFDNEEGRLYAGVFVRVRVVGKPQPDRILVEERAIGTDLAGKYVMVVDEKDVAQRRYIVPGQLEGTMRVVLEGLKGNERYITIGTLRARPGLPVNPVEMAAES